MAKAQPGTLPTDMRNLIGAEGSRDSSDQQLLERFISRRDEDAFTGLVRRHGNTVWGVCRRVLHQPQDVEDAFQAVFLILARKAASIRKGEAVGSWLYGVAYRTAMKARQSAARRQHVLKEPVEPRTEPPASSEAACRELQRVLDEEVQRLVGKYRAPFVLCCLEGMSRAEAARELGCKEGTLSSRLAQARKLLQSRLLRRGVTLSAVLTAAALAQNTASAAPAALLQSTPQAVLPAGSGQAAGSALSPAVLALAECLIRSMGRSSVVMGVTFLLGLTLLIAGTSLAAIELGSDHCKGLTVQATAVEVAPKIGAPGQGPAFDSQVVTLAFSPDGKRLVTAGARAIHPGHLKICDVETARELVTLKAIPGTSSVAFAPDGQTLASGEFSGAIKLRDPATGQERASWSAHPTGVRSVAFAPDGESLLSSGTDGTVRLWDVKTQQERQLFQGHAEEVVAAAYFRHGKGLVTASRDQTAILWDAETGEQRFTLRGHQDAIEAVAVAPDDKLVATASRDWTVRLWEADTGKETAVLRHNEGPVNALAFSPDGKLLVTAADRTVRFWNAQTLQPVATLNKQSRAISTLAFSPTGNYLANGSSLGLVLFALGFTEDGKPVFGKGSGQEYAQSFKGKTEIPPGWEPYRLEAGQEVRFEPEGLRILLPLGLPLDRRGTGVVAPLTVQGDFEITLNFEILHEPAPQDAGPETRVCLEVFLDGKGPGYSMAYVSRRMAGDGIQFTGWQTVPDPEDPSRQQSNWHGTATRAKTGRLRLQRTGSLLSYYAAEGFDGPFTLLKQFPFSKENVREVRLIASPGGPQAACDVRVTDLHIRAESLPNLPPAPAPQTSSKWWLAPAFFLGLVVFLALLVWLIVWRRTWKDRRAEAVADPEEARPKAVPASSKRLPQRLSLLLLGFLTCLTAGLLVFGLLAADEKKEMPKELAWDFRGRPLPADFKLFGALTEEQVQSEPEGLRITLAKERKKLGHCGLSLPVNLRGDVEITATIEMLHADVPPGGYGAGVLLAVNQVVRVGRVVQPNGEQSIRWDRFKGPGQQRGMECDYVPCQARTVQLRLKRTGTTMFYLWAPAPEEDFTEIHHCEFGPEDLTLIRLVTETNQQPCRLDVRLIDLRIKRLELPESSVPSEAAASAPGFRWKVWLAAAIPGLGLLVALGLLLPWRRLRLAEQKSAPEPVQDEPAGADRDSPQA